MDNDILYLIMLATNICNAIFIVNDETTCSSLTDYFANKIFPIMLSAILTPIVTFGVVSIQEKKSCIEKNNQKIKIPRENKNAKP